MHRASYWKTTALALAGAVACLAAILALIITTAVGSVAAASMFVLALASGLCWLVGCGGLVCLWRDARITAGKADLFALAANRVPGPGLLSRLGLRFFLGPALRPGDVVQVRTLAEIRQTLSADGTLDGLPFMAEMQACCGESFRVHRRIDKINDMRHKTGLRRMQGAVTLTEVRCSGAEHGGCQAECQILWKDAWLKRLPSDSPLSVQRPSAPTVRGAEARVYICQMTRLWEASRPMSRFDIRADLRPLLWGNIGAGGYSIAMLTRLFNAAQRLRGGTGFPALPPPGDFRPAVLPEVRFADRQPVRVRSREEIVQTLKNSRTKGLWYDRDMVRFCGRPAVLRKHVERVIHEASAAMVFMKTPCVTLEGVVATGEFLRLCPQHEYIFWREAWLGASAGDRSPAAPRT